MEKTNEIRECGCVCTCVCVRLTLSVPSAISCWYSSMMEGVASRLCLFSVSRSSSAVIGWVEEGEGAET